MNLAILSGHVGQDPKVEYLPGNVCQARFPLATTEVYKNKAGERVESTTWHNIVAWRGKGELVEKYVVKGMRIGVTGKIDNSSYEKEGVKKYFSSVIADNIEFQSKKETSSPKNSSAPDSAPDPNFEGPELGPDDLPF